MLEAVAWMRSETLCYMIIGYEFFMIMQMPHKCFLVLKLKLVFVTFYGIEIIAVCVTYIHTMTELLFQNLYDHY